MLCHSPKIDICFSGSGPSSYAIPSDHRRGGKTGQPRSYKMDHFGQASHNHMKSARSALRFLCLSLGCGISVWVAEGARITDVGTEERATMTKTDREPYVDEHSSGRWREAGADRPNNPLEPVGVDMRKLPPPPTSDRQPKEAPAPGIPDYRPRLVRDVKLDLGRRLGVDISEIVLGDLASATWPDFSLGCPRPGQVYGQAIVPGYRITLSAGGREYVYHTDARTRFVICREIYP